MGQTLSVVQKVITDEINASLTRPILDAEIKQATFQLGSLKAPGPDGLKIITKILANKLKPILKTVATLQQSAFVPGQLIQDNILVAHKAFHHLKLKKRGGLHEMPIKLDFNKAYDRVQWDFLQALLLKMGFNPVWTEWVMEFISTVSFSVMVNGESRASFILSSGLRQGDPLSPYWFILIADVLSLLISNQLQDHKLAGMRLTRNCPALSHLFFTDDALLFSKASIADCLALKSTVEEYCVAFAIIGNAKYLGLPSFWGRSKSEAYGFLMEQAIQKKQGWKQNLLSQAGREILMKSVGVYYPSSDIRSAVKWQKASWAWASLLQGRDLLLKGLRWQVGNGASIQFWEDRWIPKNHNFHVQTGRPPECGPIAVSEVINQHRKEWDHHKLKPMVGEHDFANIISIPISVKDKTDSLVWHFSPKGNYEVKSRYHLAINEQRCGNGTTASSSSQPSCELWKFIWSLNIQPKLCHFWWRVCRNKLATKENLHRRRCTASQHCPTCNGAVESIKHILFHGSWTRAVCPQQAVSFAIPVLSTWVPPLQDQLKFNCDASFSKDGSSSSIAVVLRDWEGKLIAGSTSTMLSSSVSQSEARAVRLACLLASSLALANLHVESDNKSVIKLSATELDPPSESLAIFHDICASRSRLGLLFRWIPRTANKVAHWLASCALKGTLPLDWVGNPLVKLQALLVFDSPM
ncbi:uncharacterized protein LOC114278664 [Camellia sinensis]|uniref:uncharacterized protein LOC114278664 n=1 Tax=Camellia sinensis TaxID=4442 RepID=UPI0010359BD7|nr:uncharacterized protein LOC114278664 [Camellia sinensis]